MAAAPPLTAVLAEIGQQIDADLSRGNRDRVAALGTLAATVAQDLGPSAPREHIAWLMKWGEQFHRWRLFQSGCEYWKAMYSLLQRHGAAQSPEGEIAITVAGAFNFLSGGMDSNPSAVQALLSMGSRLLGDANPLLADCHARLRSASGSGFGAAARPAPVAAPPAQPAPQPAFPGKSSNGGFGGSAPAAAASQGPAGWGSAASDPSRGFAPAPAAAAAPSPAAAPASGWSKGDSAASWNMAPAARPAPPANVDESLSLWVTLAFLAIATADGKVDDREYLVWKETIQRMQLPDVWDKYGADGLMKMLQAGRLQLLSVEFSSLPRDTKVRFGTILKALVLADGVADPRELTEAARILGWLGLGMNDIP
ncbi:MAG: hypothetical protein U0165_16450 [Polyangiaceae bacterium]